MPTYDYRCDACGHTFDVFQSIMDGALRKCPKCKKQKLRRLIGAGSGIIFKGSGFYETDYKRSRTSDKSGPEKPAEKPPEPKPGKKPGKKESRKSKDKA